MELTSPPITELPKNNGTGDLSVAGLGQCSLDFLCTVDQYPESDTKCEFQEFSIQGGGPVATALVALARWGISARFAGLVCQDRFGRLIQEGLASENVDLSATVVRPDGRSQLAFICVEENTGKRTIFWGRPDVPPIDFDEIPDDFLDDVHALHLDGLFIDVSIELARKAREKGIPVILDAGSVRPGTHELIPHVDHLIAAEHFARQFAPTASLPATLAELKHMGPQVVTVTLGDKGSVSLWEERPYQLPALPVQAKDTTAAGDVFHGAYIYGLLQGWAPPECIRWASISAALCCLTLGGRAGIPTLEAVRGEIDRMAAFTPLPA